MLWRCSKAAVSLLSIRTGATAFAPADLRAFTCRRLRVSLEFGRFSHVILASAALVLWAVDAHVKVIGVRG